jgi:hypothetical protein
MNRTLRVDLVKKEKAHENGTDQSGAEFEEKAKIISNLVEESAIKIGIFMCAYVLLDTVRKVAVAKASN